MFLKLKSEIDKMAQNVISEDRKNTLRPLIDFIQYKVISDEAIRLNFICTHNSRRSHLCQIWAQTMAHYFKVNNVSCYSAGTEATALFFKVIETLEETGFEIHSISKAENPIYNIKFSENEHPIIGFSKTIESSFNPKSNFAAIMTCSSADVGCPMVLGSERRISITYEDPKIYDETIHQTEKYTERSLQIASEMFYVFSKINHGKK